MTESDSTRANAVLRALTHTATATHDVAERLIADTGQSIARWQVLEQFSTGPATVPMVARRLGQTRQSTQRIADILAAEGLVVRRENPDHRTSPLFEMTADGEAVLARIRESVQPWLEHVGAKLSPTEHEVLIGQLEVLRESAVVYRRRLGS